MRTIRTFTLSLLVAVAAMLGALGAAVAAAPAPADHVAVVADDTHW